MLSRGGEYERLGRARSFAAPFASRGPFLIPAAKHRQTDKPRRDEEHVGSGRGRFGHATRRDRGADIAFSWHRCRARGHHVPSTRARLPQESGGMSTVGSVEAELARGSSSTDPRSVPRDVSPLKSANLYNPAYHSRLPLVLENGSHDIADAAHTAI